MLMMVDPHVHFHVIPRYDGVRSWNGIAVTDHGWPKPPDLAQAWTPDADQTQALVKAIAGLHGLTIRLEDAKPGLRVVLQTAR